MKAKQTSLFDTIFIDEFAGGGGASTGIELATGRPKQQFDNMKSLHSAMVS